MTYEYVKFTNEEVDYAKMIFLKSQLDSLDTLKRNKNFLKYRNEEFWLKITLKNKLDETLTNLSIIDKLLPKTKKITDNLGNEDIFDISGLTLEEEINMIKKKIEKLNSNL